MVEFTEMFWWFSLGFLCLSVAAYIVITAYKRWLEIKLIKMNLETDLTIQEILNMSNETMEKLKPIIAEHNQTRKDLH